MLGHTIDLPQSTEYAKEMRKWESQPTKFGPPGRPYTFQEYPKRMYKAASVPGKGIEVTDAHTVQDADDERNLLSRGFARTIADAFREAEAQHTEHGKLAAERNWEIAHGRISEQAAEEVRAAEAEFGARHLPMVPETPIKKRGRPKKVA